MEKVIKNIEGHEEVEWILGNLKSHESLKGHKEGERSPPTSINAPSCLIQKGLLALDLG